MINKFDIQYQSLTLGLIYRSRWRPSEDEVKGWLQNGQALSLAALMLTLPFWVVVGADDEGVETVAGVCEASAMIVVVVDEEEPGQPKAGAGR